MLSQKKKNGVPLLSDITEQFRWRRPLHADVGEEFLASVLQACAKDIDGIVDNQETVVIALAEVDGDRGILLVVALQVELLLRGELAGVDGGRDAGTAIAEHREGVCADIVAMRVIERLACLMRLMIWA